MLERWGTEVVAFGRSPQEADGYFLIRAYADLADLNARQDAFYSSDEWPAARARRSSRASRRISARWFASRPRRSPTCAARTPCRGRRSRSDHGQVARHDGFIGYGCPRRRRAELGSAFALQSRAGNTSS